MDDSDRLEGLVGIMDRLRDPGGCPWDLEQDYHSLRAYLLEECYEVADALDRDDHAALKEELGDLLFQIVFLSRIAKEKRQFTINDVVRGIAEKMIRRHPHVFGSERADTAEQVVRNWETIKRREKDKADSQPDPRSVLDGVPTALPAVLKAQQLGARAARVGFDWEGPQQVLDKVEEEVRELRLAIAGDDREAVRGELGDLLFSVVMLARRLDVDAEGALEGTNRKFRERFSRVKMELEAQGITVEEASVERMEELWKRAKSSER